MSATPITRKEERQSGIQVISRAAAILRSVRDQPDGLSLAQIAQRVGLPRSTVQRIVGALVSEGMLMAASPAGRVRIGAGIVALANGSQIDVVELAHPHIKALAEAAGETVDLAVLKKDHLVFVDQVAGSQRLRAVSAVGEVFPLHSTANGKACLALMSDEEIRRLLPKPLPPLADGSARDIEALLNEIAEVRKTGIAFDEQEHTRGISAVGGAFRDPLGSIYAVSVPTPSGRFDVERKRLKPLLIDCLRKLNQVLRA
jgi:DNA-binding IclR family transcriptional regulator